MTAPHWLPDWTDASQYPALQTTRLRKWSWEFLRRNASYQADYMTHIAPYIIGKAYDQSLIPFDKKICNPPVESGETEEDYRHRMESSGQAEWQIKDPASHVAEIYGIKLLPPDPADAGSSLLLEGAGSRVAFGSMLESGRAGPGPEDMAITFNLSWPLAPQLESARRVLEGRARHLRDTGKIELIEQRNRAVNFATYLRLLDAEAVGAKRDEVAQVIFPNVPNNYPTHNGRSRVKDGLKAAKRLRDYDYRFIIFGEEPSEK